MRAFEFYRKIKQQNVDSGNEVLAEKHGYTDELESMYNEVYDTCRRAALKETFQDPKLKEFFYDDHIGEKQNPEIGDFTLVVLCNPQHPKEILQLEVNQIKRNGDIPFVDKDRVFVSSKVFEKMDDLEAFVVEMTIKFKGEYEIRKNY